MIESGHHGMLIMGSVTTKTLEWGSPDLNQVSGRRGEGCLAGITVKD